MQAIKLRNTVKDPKHRAWAALALAEFENDLENADAALAMLDSFDDLAAIAHRYRDD